MCKENKPWKNFWHFWGSVASRRSCLYDRVPFDYIVNADSDAFFQYLHQRLGAKEPWSMLKSNKTCSVPEYISWYDRYEHLVRLYYKEDLYWLGLEK
mmetsp:Transcript_19139/g.35669  ORF Transcript_19139/g.35669 Transcript_19139/m.35669 type:complete len:97 (-) Transcript_19139:89-379(-)